MNQQTSFYEYMKQEYSSNMPGIGLQYAKDLHMYFNDSPFGDLTMDMMRDKDFPKRKSSPVEIREHISRKTTEHCGYHMECRFPVTAGAVLGTLKEALKEYEKVTVAKV